MKDKKKIIITILIIFTLIICMLLCMFVINKKKLSNDNKEITNSELENDIDLDIDESIGEKELENIISYMNSFDSVGFVKSVTERTYNEDGSDDLLRQEYIVSEVNLIKGEDNTLDYLQTSPTFKQNINFKDVFGVNVKDYYEPYSLTNAVAEFLGVGCEYTNASIHKELYKYTGQKTYILETDSKVLKQIISSLDYDEILDSYCYFNITDSTNGNSYISSITTQVIYKKDDIVKEKNFVLIIQIYNQDGSNHPNDNEEIE